MSGYIPGAHKAAESWASTALQNAGARGSDAQTEALCGIGWALLAVANAIAAPVVARPAPQTEGERDR